ncbi:MAG: UbiA family prenyltransferase [Candidatus Latescibacterota bacterium]|nr:MAG: UbiA family prenyltransferase [Candidatus Latescibacterota bacterium]
MRLLDFLFALRPLVLVPAWSFFILGWGLLGDAVAFPPDRFLFLSLVLAGVYLVNQVVDFESDRINRKGFFLQQGIFTRRLYVAAAGVLLGAGIAGAVVRDAFPALVVASAFIGLAYSLPPLRLSARPGFDLLANAAGYGLIAVLLGAGREALASAALRSWVAVPAASFLAVAAVFLHTTVMDLDGDRRTGKRTSGVLLGRERCVRLAAACGVAATAAALTSATPVLIVACAATAALAILAVVRPSFPSRAVCVGSTILFVLAAALFAPLFLVAIAALALATRLYYRRRFALAYPAL